MSRKRHVLCVLLSASTGLSLSQIASLGGEPTAAARHNYCIRLGELIEEGLVTRVRQGYYEITPRGRLYAASQGISASEPLSELPVHVPAPRPRTPAADNTIVPAQPRVASVFDLGRFA